MQKSKIGTTMMVVKEEIRDRAKAAAALKKLSLQEFVEATLTREVGKILKAGK